MGWDGGRDEMGWGGRALGMEWRGMGEVLSRFLSSRDHIAASWVHTPGAEEHQHFGCLVGIMHCWILHKNMRRCWKRELTPRKHEDNIHRELKAVLGFLFPVQC